MIRPAIFYLLAASVPTAALWFAAPADRTAHEMAVSPFGWRSLLVVHCAGILPLAGVAAAWLVKRTGPRSPYSVAVVGAVVAVAGFFAVRWLAGLLDDTEAGFTVRCILRSVFCLLLAWPWAVAAHYTIPPAPVSRVVFVVGVVAGFILPGVWANRLAREATTEAQDTLAAQQVARALPLIEGVCDLDPDRQIVEAQGNLKMPAARERLTGDLKRMADDVARLNPAALKPAERLRYANTLLQLDRAAEAEPILRGLAHKQPAANLPLARALQRLGRYDESDTAARELLAVALPDVEKYTEARKWCRDGFDLLAENATRRGSTSGREAVFKEGLEKLPTEQAYFHFQLGRHYKLTGRLFEAVKELNEAVRLDKSFEPSAGAILRDVRENTPACLIGRSGGP